MKALKIFGILVFLSNQFAIGQNEDTNISEQLILNQQSARFSAMIEADVVKLKSLLADDLTYGHTKGSTETKSGFIETVKTERIDYLSFVPRDVNVRVYEKTAVLTGFIDVKVIYKMEELVFTTRFLEVQRKEDGDWLLTAWQPVIYIPN
ncbi:nuclear transport factor 2 family protein [Muriicola sp.]|uniref:nuclear transport factor 2 family protein n=1 Tax=Muriicola sp. TaxID=2020856 RepID=UPI003C771095